MSTIQFTDSNDDIVVLVARHVTDVRMRVKEDKATFTFWMSNHTSSEVTRVTKDAKDLLRIIKQVIGRPDIFTDVYL